MDYNLFLKWARSRHVIHFKFQGPKHTSEITEARIVKFFTPKMTTYHPQMGVIVVIWSRDCFTNLLFAVMQRVARVRQRQLSYLWYNTGV